MAQLEKKTAVGKYIPIVLAVYCGLRRTEALGMSWSNIDFEENKIYVKQKVVELTKNGKKYIEISEDLKTESSRKVFAMHPDMKKILLEHKEQQEMYRKQFKRSYSKKYLDMVCVDQMGMRLRPNFVTEHFAVLLNKHGLRKIRFHDLRHTCASLLVAKNINMKIIQVWLGHSNMSTTADIYSHLDDNAKSEAGRAIESVLSINTEDTE